jgi:hypothetical protein
LVPGGNLGAKYDAFSSVEHRFSAIFGKRAPVACAAARFRGNAARYPTAIRVGAAAGAEYGAAHDPARSFKFGLQRILDGIEAFIS